MSVDCYIFISGYFGIKLKMKSILSLIIQVLFYSLGFLVIKLISGGKFEASDITYIFPISRSLWWFITIYMILMFLSPFLNYGIEKLEKRQFTFLLLVILYFNCFSGFVLGLDTQGGYSIMNFISIYILAGYIKKYNIHIKNPLPIYIIASLLIFSIEYIFREIIVIKGWNWGLDIITH